MMVTMSAGSRNAILLIVPITIPVIVAENMA